MLPITYENQCQACHSLDRPELTAKIYHRQPPAEIHAALLAGATDKILREGRSELLEQSIDAAALPNDRAPMKENVRKLIDDLVNKAERRITQDVCGKCHYAEPSDRPGLAPVVPPRVPEIWFEHAKFDHRAHRAVDCQLCHEKAYSDPARAADIRGIGASYLPDRDTCLLCHAPPGRFEGESRGGARFDCVECHRYHNGKERPAGARGENGAQADSPAHPLGVRAFHAGEPESQP